MKKHGPQPEQGEEGKNHWGVRKSFLKERDKAKQASGKRKKTTLKRRETVPYENHEEKGKTRLNSEAIKKKKEWGTTESHER